MIRTININDFNKNYKKLINQLSNSAAITKISL